MSEDLAASEKDVFLPRQFRNDANVATHELTTGPEVWWQLQFNSQRPDAFIAGVGTGGTVMGVARFFRARQSNVKVYALEPAESPTLSVGHRTGHHRIQGISDEFIPDIVDLHQLDGVVAVSDGDAILMAQKLAADLGVGVGISSGANFIGALKVQNELGRDAIVTTVFPDDNKKYLSTSLLREEPVREAYLSPDVELVDYHAFKRVCHTCCEMDDCPQRENFE
jgi:cysteine synthase A